eukprot:s44_g1.t1
MAKKFGAERRAQAAAQSMSGACGGRSQKIGVPFSTCQKGWRPLVYSWGSCGSGRLGFEQGTEDKLQMLQIRENHKGKVPERTQTTGVKHLRIYPPVRVANRWKKGQKDATHHVAAEKPESIDKESAKWIDCQQKLFEELPDCKTKALQDQERKAEKTCKNQLDFICQLWNKPSSGSEVTEYTLRQLRKDIEVEYLRTLNALQMSGSGDGPQMEKLQWVKTDIDVKKRLLKFEELLWILQQQPLYMANLSDILRKNSVQDQEHQVFRRTCERIFHDLHEPRTLHLCKATLKLIMESELDLGRFLTDLFDPIKSHVTFLITQMATHPAFVDGIAFPILNPEDETSLMSTIIKYTMMKKDGETPRVGGSGEGDVNMVTGVFVTHLFEYEELMQNAERGAHQGTEKNRYLNFQNELSAFQRSCVEANRGGTEREKDVHAGCIPNFIRNFVSQLFQDERAKDFKMLLVSCFKSLRHSPAVKGLEPRDPKICTPIASLVLVNILASVLEALQTPAFSLVVLKIRKRVFENHMNRKNAAKGESDFDRLDVAELLLDRVLYNVQALAKVFQRCVHKQMFQAQFPTKVSQAPKEEPESRQICDEIRDFTCQVLHQELMEVMRSSERSGGWMEEGVMEVPGRDGGNLEDLALWKAPSDPAMLESDDPFNLRRFSDRQRTSYGMALEEMRAGKKKSHWIWFVFPTPPYVENGVERGSPKNQFFAIRSYEEALAFLNFQEDGVNLRKNYLEILEVLQEQLKLGMKLWTLVGEDENKIRSSVKFFLEVAKQSSDNQLQLSCEETLHLIDRGFRGHVGAKTGALALFLWPVSGLGDTYWDPHDRSKGFWHAHIGWLFAARKFQLPSVEYRKVVSLGDPKLWSLGVPTLLCSLWSDAFCGLFVAGALRWALVQHITFAVNSIAHGELRDDDVYSFDPAADGHGPCVSIAVSLLSLGEGWHDYHHLFPWDYAAAELDAWEQFNPTKVFIDFCSMIGLASHRRR